jgi:ubiquinone/menaquinone biosynthesis C-methylase UbiE
LDFADATFDAAIFESVLTIIPGDPQDALSEIVRVLRPGGRVGGNEATLEASVPGDYASLVAQHPAIHKTYPKLVWKLLFDARFRKAHQIDEQLTKLSQAYMGYALIVGQK